jgi:hypothetical protein
VETRSEGAAVADVAFTIDEDLALELVRELAASSIAFRDAFPTLVRRVEIWSCDELVVVRVVYEWDHSGTFFELMSPTRRSLYVDFVRRLMFVVRFCAKLAAFSTCARSSLGSWRRLRDRGHWLGKGIPESEDADARD